MPISTLESCFQDIKEGRQCDIDNDLHLFKSFAKIISFVNFLTLCYILSFIVSNPQVKQPLTFNQQSIYVKLQQVKIE